MWRLNDKPSINTFTHVSKENLNFATALRNDEGFVSSFPNKELKVQKARFEDSEQSKYKAKDQILLHIICNRLDCAKDAQNIADLLDEV